MFPKHSYFTQCMKIHYPYSKQCIVKIMNINSNGARVNVTMNNNLNMLKCKNNYNLNTYLYGTQ